MSDSETDQEVGSSHNGTDSEVDADNDELSVIEEKVSRVEEIIETLEDGSPSLKRAKQLREEGEELLTELRDDLEVSDGDVSDE